MEENILDFTKIKCKEHPFEVVSNYCMNEKCMAGLCSNCICIHTQMHMREGTTAAYRPLKQIHKMAFNSIQSHLNVLKYDKERIVKIMKNLADRKQNFRILLNQAKKDVLNLVERVFEQAQIKFQQQVKNQEKKTGLHSSFQIESLCRKINRQIEILINEAQLLNTYRFLDVIKNIKVNALNEVVQVHEQVSKQITENQQFSPTLNYKKECLIDVQVMIRRLFSLTFLYPRVNCLKMPQNYAIQYGKQNIIKMSQTGVDYKPFFNTSAANFIKTAPSTQESLRNSKIFERINVQQKTQRPSSNLSRNTSFSNMNIIPQFLDSKNFPLQIYSRNTPSQFKLTGSKFFTKILTRQ